MTVNEPIYIEYPPTLDYNREHVQTDADERSFRAYSPSVITYVEARDQSNGTGGYVRYYRGGIQEKFVQLDFVRSPGADGPIDFVVEVWAQASSEFVKAGEFQAGELTDRSLFAFR